VKVGLEPAVPALANALADEDHEVRYYVTKTLDDAGQEVGPAVRAIIAALEKEKDANIRYYLVKSLKNAGTEAKPAVSLLQKLTQDAEENVRQAAGDALATIKRKTP
jgi:HEAT repeat protein